MARQTSTQAETRDDWQRLIPPLVANAADLPHLEAPTAQLGSIVTQTGDLLEQQAALAASKQEVSRRLQALVSDGRRLAAFLRSGVKQRYGARSEKLAAFNLTPPQLFTIDDLGGWPAVKKEFFDPDNGSVTKIFQGQGIATE